MEAEGAEEGCVAFTTSLYLAEWEATDIALIPHHNSWNVYR